MKLYDVMVEEFKSWILCHLW